MEAIAGPPVVVPSAPAVRFMAVAIFSRLTFVSWPYSSKVLRRQPIKRHDLRSARRLSSPRSLDRIASRVRRGEGARPAVDMAVAQRP
jgi:hypothetical protein